MVAEGLGARLGAGKVAEVFALGGDRVAKLYRSPDDKRSAFREAAMLAVAGGLGLPVPAVHGVRTFGARWAVVMDRIDGPAFTEVMLGDRERLPDAMRAMAALHRRIHAVSGRHAPGLKMRLAANIAAASPLLGPPRVARLNAALAALPDGDRLCHGDFHPWNIIGEIDRETVVDWLDAGCGAPEADVCRSYVLIVANAPDLAPVYVDLYAEAAGLTRAAVFVWLPVTAAARLAEDVPAEADALMAMADTL